MPDRLCYLLLNAFVVYAGTDRLVPIIDERCIGSYVDRYVLGHTNAATLGGIVDSGPVFFCIEGSPMQQIGRVSISDYS